MAAGVIGCGPFKRKIGDSPQLAKSHPESCASRLGSHRPVREPADLRYTFYIKYLSPIGDRHANYQHVLRHPHPDVLGRACAAPFHATYGEFKASIDIRLLTISEGNLPRRAAELVLDWAELHQRELLEDWDLCQKKKHPKPIEPLK